MVTLNTKDLVLKEYEEKYVLSAHNNFLSQEETAKYTLWRPTSSVEEAKAKLEYWNSDKDSVLFWLVFEKNSDAAIGFVSAANLGNGVYGNVGIAIGLDYINKGYGSQVLEALIYYISKLGGVEIHYSHFEGNDASKNLALKYGFEYYCIGKKVKRIA